MDAPCQAGSFDVRSVSRNEENHMVAESEKTSDQRAAARSPLAIRAALTAVANTASKVMRGFFAMTLLGHRRIAARSSTQMVTAAATPAIFTMNPVSPAETTAGSQQIPPTAMSSQRYSGSSVMPARKTMAPGVKMPRTYSNADAVARIAIFPAIVCANDTTAGERSMCGISVNRSGQDGKGIAFADMVRLLVRASWRALCDQTCR